MNLSNAELSCLRARAENPADNYAAGYGLPTLLVPPHSSAAQDRTLPQRRRWSATVPTTDRNDRSSSPSRCNLQ
jgi:hypothetical protein